MHVATAMCRRESPLLPSVKSLLAGLLAAALVAAVASRLRTLTTSGAVAATLVGGIAFGLGGLFGSVALLSFFMTSTALTRWRRHQKYGIGSDGHTPTLAGSTGGPGFENGSARNAGQVLANGGVAAICLVFSCALRGPLANAFRVAFLASLAGANADTWATEVGSALGGTPYSLRDLRPVPPGTSGAVSVAGTLASIAGAALIGALALLPQAALAHPQWFAAVAGGCGLAGAGFDSLAGAIWQAQWQDEGGRWRESPTNWQGSGCSCKDAPPEPQRGLRWMTNDAVNVICTGSAAILALVLASINPL